MSLRFGAIATLAILVCLGAPAVAQETDRDCPRVAIVTLPGVTWEMVADHDPPNLLRLADEGALGSMSVRTNSSRTSYASGFATIGAGTRADGGATSGGVVSSGPPLIVGGTSTTYLRRDVVPAGTDEITEMARDADYEPRVGSLASSLTDGPMIAIGNGDPGIDPPSPLGFGRYVLLGAMERDLEVEAAAVDERLLLSDPDAPWGARTDPDAFGAALDEALSVDCSVLLVDHGDLMRVDSRARTLERAPGDEDLRKAIYATDDIIGSLRDSLDPERDLLLVVSPTSPWWDEEVHLGVAVAWGKGFPAGSGLESASTRQANIVTLPDVAPTVLRHLGMERPAGMIGRSFVPIDGTERRLERAIDLDRESVFAHTTQAGISTGFVLAQIALYGMALGFFRSRSEKISPEKATGWLQAGGLAIAAFPLVSYLQSPIDGHALGPFWFVVVLLALDAAVVTAVVLILKEPLEQLLAITAATTILFVGDLLLGTNLQLNAVWGNDPIVAGRFTGLGNIAFAVLGASSLMTGALLVHRWPRARWVYPAVAALFAITVLVDGAPGLGSDVGGVLALVPALGITWLMLLGKKPSARALLISAVGAVLVLGLFLALDLSRPSSERTHLGRLWEDIDERGTEVFFDTIERKARTNLRVFRSTIWTYLVPPALAIVAVFLLRPRGRWRRLAQRYPRLRAGLIGGLLLGVLGFAVNDSGIVVPAMVLSFLAPMALLLHLTLERGSGVEPAG